MILLLLSCQAEKEEVLGGPFVLYEDAEEFELDLEELGVGRDGLDARGAELVADLGPRLAVAELLVVADHAERRAVLDEI